MVLDGAVDEKVSKEMKGEIGDTKPNSRELGSRHRIPHANEFLNWDRSPEFRAAPNSDYRVTRIPRK